jgi:hypothetical protein
MSTQRRAHRTSPATKIRRGELRFRRDRASTERAETLEFGSALEARFGHAPFRGITAPLMSILWLAWAWLHSSDETLQEAADRVATKSLLSDHRSETIAGLANRWSSPPLGVRSPSESVPQAVPRSSPPHIPHSPARPLLHTTLPHAPVGKVRRAERHDGKRDLHFQHAA